VVHSRGRAYVIGTSFLVRLFDSAQPARPGVLEPRNLVLALCCEFVFGFTKPALKSLRNRCGFAESSVLVCSVASVLFAVLPSDGAISRRCCSIHTLPNRDCESRRFGRSFGHLLSADVQSKWRFPSSNCDPSAMSPPPTASMRQSA
jgi:hypothetical protein